MEYSTGIAYNRNTYQDLHHHIAQTAMINNFDLSAGVDRAEKCVSRSGRSRPFTPFETEEQAKAFAGHLLDDIGVRAEILRISGSLNSGSSGATSLWDLKVPYKDVFKVKLLYKVRDKYRIRDIAQLANADKKVLLRDYLLGDAHLKGGWREPMCPLSQIEWYAKVSGLPVPAAKKAVAEAKNAYYKQHATGRFPGYRIAAVMTLTGIVLFLLWNRWRFAPYYGSFFAAAGMAFLLFAMTRRRRPGKWGRRRLPG